MSFAVTIRQHDGPIAVEPGATILEAALAQGVPYPHGCRSGNCGACKSVLEAGEVELAAYSDYALTEEERAQGLILACRAMPWSDARVAWLETDEVAIHPLRQIVTRVVGLENLTHDIRRVRLEIVSGGPFDFSAGQYAAVRVSNLPARDFSMANRPDQPVLEFHVRHMSGGAASRYIVRHLALGESVRLEGPFGSAHLREHHTGPILAIAGGSGLAPVKSIVETALHRGARQPIHLYFGVRDERDLYLDEHFTALAAAHPNLRFTPVLSEPLLPTRRRTGFVHEAVAADLEDLDGAKAYLAGPPVMVEAATAMLLEHGMSRQDIHADAFYTEADKLRLSTGTSA
jgi:CDP-4-dehydro-6-deoxyglucose reductase/ferredoxin-NAD(P)+ reductase (naphthalene dioxygenase ferredoxin-specific)